MWLATRSSRAHIDSPPSLACALERELRWAPFARDRERRVEAPPGFEPGVEVLQTSALPLGDGAPWGGVERTTNITCLVQIVSDARPTKAALTRTPPVG